MVDQIIKFYHYLLGTGRHTLKTQPIQAKKDHKIFATENFNKFSSIKCLHYTVFTLLTVGSSRSHDAAVTTIIFASCKQYLLPSVMPLWVGLVHRVFYHSIFTLILQVLVMNQYPVWCWYEAVAVATQKHPSTCTLVSPWWPYFQSSQSTHLVGKPVW